MGWLPVIGFVLIGVALLTVLRIPIERFTTSSIMVISFWLGIVTTTFLLMASALLTGRFFLHILYVFVLLSVVVVCFKRKFIFVGILKSSGMHKRRRREFFFIVPLFLCICVVLILAINLATRFPS